MACGPHLVSIVLSAGARGGARRWVRAIDICFVRELDSLPAASDLQMYLNPLFLRENSQMLLGDAKRRIEEIVS
jgi:hypothetical protein